MSDPYEKEIEDWAVANLMVGGSWIFFALIAGLMVMGATFAWYLWKPHEVAHEHRVNVESHQYQEARKESELIHEQELSKINVQISQTTDPDVKAALEGQRRVLKKRIERERRKQR